MFQKRMEAKTAFPYHDEPHKAGERCGDMPPCGPRPHVHEPAQVSRQAGRAKAGAAENAITYIWAVVNLVTFCTLAMQSISRQQDFPACYRDNGKKEE